MTAIAFSSSVGPVAIDCVISEKHESELEIMLNPVEFGADITDHAYIQPKKVTLDVADENAAATFADLVAFQESREPFTLVTGLSVYDNMLIKSIEADRDAQFSRVLRAKIYLQEIIIVSTAYAAPEAGDGTGSEPGNPGGTNSTKSAAPDPSRSGDPATADRASGTVQRGDAGTSAAAPADQSLLYQMFGE